MIDSKRYLLGVRMADLLLSTNVLEMGRIKDQLFKITPTLKDVSSISESAESKTETCLAALEGYMENLNKKTDYFIQQREEAKAYLSQIDKPQYYSVLYKRYFEYDKESYRYKTLEKIAAEMNASRQYIDELHGKALKYLDDIMKGNLTKLDKA